jgi:carbonic anhydrase/acetyltransferase-like protein (isoleucine patch superfamily)
MNGATIGAGSIVAVGAVVLEGTVIPPNSVAMGVPAKVKRPTDEGDRQRIAHAADHYVDAARRYAAQK